MKFKLPNGKILFSGIALLLLSFITIVVFFIYEYKKVNDVASRAAYTNEQLQHCEKLMNLVLDIENGSRAYFLTGQKFLDLNFTEAEIDSTPII